MATDYDSLENCHYEDILYIFYIIWMNWMLYEPKLREVGVVMVPCRASRKLLNRPPAYHDGISIFSIKEQNHGTPTN